MMTEMIKKQKRFLVVDDQFLIRDFLKEFFLRFDMQAVEACNGREAVDRWEEEDFNAILMDVQMPELDGLQATRIIRQREEKENRPRTPIFALSGYVSDDPEKDCRNAGMDGFIAKPVSINTLLETVIPLAK